MFTNANEVHLYVIFSKPEGNQRFVYQSKMATKERVWVEKWKFCLQSESFHFILAIMHFLDDVKRLRLYKFRLFSLSEPYHPLVDGLNGMITHKVISEDLQVFKWERNSGTTGLLRIKKTRGAYSLLWPIWGDSARKGYLFQASGVW